MITATTNIYQNMVRAKIISHRNANKVGATAKIEQEKKDKPLITIDLQ
jgi:hypothetical protein